jgi:uncharacterized membrane protein YqgA involved in biofilm formation
MVPGVKSLCTMPFFGTLRGRKYMVLWGTVVNVAAIIIGGLIGSCLPRIPNGIRTTVMQGLGLAVIILGLSMTFKSSNFLIIVISLVLGGILGEWMKIEYRLEQAGKWLERVVQRGKKTECHKGGVAEGFITATLVYCVGAMAILGAMDSGLRDNHDVLYIKSMLDGVSAIIFASTISYGIIFSAVPVFLYQGSIALAATSISLFISSSSLELIILEVTAVGGVLIIGIGLNLLEIKRINVANMLPAILIAAVSVPVSQQAVQLYRLWF